MLRVHRVYLAPGLVVALLMGCASVLGDYEKAGDVDSVDTGTPAEDSGGPPRDTGTPPTDTAVSCAHPTASSTCGTAPQCDCLAGQNCTVAKGDGTTACGKAGSGGAGASCYFDVDCAAGFACQFDICVPFCSLAMPCGSVTAACYGYTIGTALGGTSEHAVSTAYVCLQQCEPANPYAVCGSTKLGCAFAGTDSTTGELITACTQSGTGFEGSSCSLYDCFAGYYCGVTDNKCHEWCRMGKADCGTGKTCAAFPPPTSYFFQGSTYGYCN